MSFGTFIRLLCFIWIASEIALALLKRSRPDDKKMDKSSGIAIWTTIFVSIALGTFLASGSYGHIDEDAHHVYRAVGAGLIMLGLLIRGIAIISLKRQFTVDVAISKDHHLITGGIYRYVRHPSYTGVLMAFFGVGLTIPNYVSIAVVFIPILAVFLYRIRVEESALLGAFGEEYKHYCTSTKRLIPGIY